MRVPNARNRSGAAGDSWRAATATWVCDATECDPCGDPDGDGDGWGNWKHIGCRSGSTSAPKGTVTNVHMTDLALLGPVPFAELCALHAGPNTSSQFQLNLLVCSKCTSVPVHTRRNLLPGLTLVPSLSSSISATSRCQVGMLAL